MGIFAIVVVNMRVDLSTLEREDPRWGKIQRKEGQMGKKSLRNQKMMRSKEQLEELTLQWKINHLFFPLRPWRKKAGAEKIFCSAGKDIAIREKKSF